MSIPFAQVPSAASIPLSPFTLSFTDDHIAHLKSLVRLSPIAPPTYENSQADRRYGVTSDWLSTIRDKWVHDFDWRACEARANSFPQFTTEIEGLKVHFAALFSEKPDAVPILVLHGWPGSFFEFLPMLQLFRDEFTPNTLPYHLIVPSLPGFVLSSGPPLDRNWTSQDSARVLDQLMKGLGFANGYVSQGGDIGSRISRVLGADYDTCKAVHLNFCPLPNAPEIVSDDSLTAFEKKGLERWNDFMTLGRAYAYEHGTRPATIGHVLASSPVALLAWIGEKFLEWVDEPLSSDTILESVSLYWLTEAFPRAIYTYREQFDIRANTKSLQERWYIHKPTGYSYFPKEIMPVPRSWAATTADIVYFKEHQKGGHFAALERPDDLKADLSEFVEQVWPGLVKK